MEIDCILYDHTRGWGFTGVCNVWTGSGCFSVQSQIRQQEEVEKKAEVAMEMSDLVVYCQPRSKEKDRFGKRMQTLVLYTKACERTVSDVMTFFCYV